MEVPLTQGKIAQIDDEDWPLVAPYRWYAAKGWDGKRWYAHALPPGASNRVTKIKMHNLILGTRWADHRDGNGLNNRRSNLRPASNSQNQQNSGHRGGASAFKGVSWDSRKGKWRVAFRWDGRHFFVGNFADETEAASAYNAAILPLAGEFTRLNVISE